MGGSMASSMQGGLSILCIIAIVLCSRLIYISWNIWVARRAPFKAVKARNAVKTLVVLGSGGHTTEILRLIGSLGRSYSPRHYVLANSDKMSRQKVVNLEQSKQSRNVSPFTISSVPRSREVAQSWISSVLSTIYASLYCLPLVFRDRPDLILVNGPGTCIPICVAGFILTVLGLKRVTIIYVESICRVQTLSLSGKILYWFADHILVQWPQLKELYPNTHYIGRLL